MPKISDDETLRVLLAALIGSRLSYSELREVRDKLLYGQISRELAQRLDDFLHNQPDRHNNSVSRDRAAKRDRWVEEMQYTAERRRMPKRDMLGAMLAWTPGSMPENAPEFMTMREMLAEYFNLVGPKNADDFMRFLFGPRSDDYFQGILDNKK